MKYAVALKLPGLPDFVPGWRPSPPDARNHVFGAMYVPKAIVGSYDLMPYEDPIYGQVGGSCVANAAVGIFKNTARVAGATEPDLSRNFVYAKAREDDGWFPDDSGLYGWDGVRCLYNHGTCREATWPENAGINTVPSAAAVAEAVSYKISQYLEVAGQGQYKVDAIRNAIYNQKAVSASAIIYESFRSGLLSGAIVPMPDPTATPIGGHCWAFIGYNDATQRFLCRNSWGTGYGANGYMYVPYAFVSQYLQDSWLVMVTATPAPQPAPGPAATTTTVSGATFSVVGSPTGVLPTGTATAVVTYNGDANNASSSGSITLPVGIAPPATTVPPLASVTDNSGGVWTLGTTVGQYGKPVLRNGLSASSGSGILISLKNGQIKVQNSLGDWWLWIGSGWSPTTAP